MITTDAKDITIDHVLRLFEGPRVDKDMVILDDIITQTMTKDPRRMQCLLVGMCLEGEASLYIDSMKREVKPGDIVIIGRERVVSDGVKSPDCKGIGILISYDFFKETVKSVHALSSLFLFARNHPVFHMEPTRADFIRDTYDRLRLKITQTNHHYRRDIAQSLFLTMIFELSDTIWQMSADNDPCRTRAEKIFTDFIELLERNFVTERRVGWYSQQLCISPKYLSETIKAVSHYTPNEWIDNYVTMELRMRLSNTTKSIKEIAHDMNFSNQSFLGKYFKEHTGESPSKFRRTQSLLRRTEL